MQKKGFRTLSLILAASMLLSSTGTNVSVFAAGVDNSVIETSEEKVVFGDTAPATSEAEAGKQDGTITETSETAAGTEQPAAEQTTAQNEAEQQSVTAEAPAENTTEQASEEEQAERTTEQTSEEETDLQEEKLDGKLEALDGALVSSVMDGALLEAVRNAYNTGTGSQVQSNEFTYAMLRSYEGVLDISAATTVTTIPQEAFYKCKFQSIELPSSIRTIEDKAFKDCTQLQEITLPDNMKVLGAEAFSGCVKLGKINSTVGQNTLPKGLETVGQSVFLDAAELTQITIPSFAKGDILTNASALFSGCSKLQSITIGASITTLPMSAFAGAGKLSETGVSITFESGSKLDKILKGAFSGIKLNSSTAEMDLSNCCYLTAVSDEVFQSAENLSTVILPASITSSVSGKSGTLVFGINTFAKTDLKQMYIKGSPVDMVKLPDYVIGIGDGCFYGNVTMTSVSLSPKLSVIPDYTFDGCTSLANVEQRQDAGKSLVKEIGDCAFRKTAIQNTDFLLDMNQLETIGYQRLTVYGVGNKSTDIEKVYSIAEGGSDVTVLDANTHQKTSNKGDKPCGSEVFTGCKNLTSVTIPASVKNIGSRAFYFSREPKNIYDTTEPEDINTDSQITTVTWESSTDKTQAVERRIGSEAFHGNVNLETVTLPENKNAGESLYIDPYAFYEDVKLANVNAQGGKNKLPATLKGLYEGAFYWCAALNNITVPSTENGTCPELGQKVFEKCITLSSIVLPNEITEIPKRFCYDAPITSFSTGTAVTQIGDLAFMGNQIVQLDLSKCTALKEIGAGAFAYEDGISDTKNVYSAYNLKVYGQPAVMTTVILPNRLESLFVNSGAFRAQKQLTTMKTPGAGTDNQVYIPDYMTEPGQGIFGDTGVRKAIWQADTTGKNQWTNIPPMMYHDCSNIVKAEDVLPTGSYVQNIGKQAFYGSSVQSADISHYTGLKVIGSGSVASSNFPGAFEDCKQLRTVKLPDAEMQIDTKTFMSDTALESIDLGSVKSIGKQAFEGCTALKTVKFPESLKVSGEAAFKNCTGLLKVEFGCLENISKEAFMGCTALVLTDSGLPDTLQQIGNSAFKGDTKLGKAVFGSQLTSIDTSAFESSGLTEADFTKAKNLVTINTRAFRDTQLTRFELKNTKVTSVKEILTGCKELVSAEFGDGVEYIGVNTLAGCPKFKNLTFSSTTTVDNQVFKSVVDNEATATNNGLDKGKVHITVNTPKETVVPIGRTFYFPYEVTATPASGKNPTAQFEYALIGFGNASSDVDQYVKISACLRDGYFKQQQSSTDEKYKVLPGPYYEALSVSPSRTVTGRSPVTSVDTIQMSGLKPTDGCIDFTIGCTITFECDDKTMPVIETESFTAKYNLNVKEVPLYADLYRDKNKTEKIAYGQNENIQVVSNSGTRGSVQCYYQMDDGGVEYITPDTFNVVVETDNPDVLYPSNTSSGKKQSSYTTNATQKQSNGEIKENQNGETFWLVPAGVGTANIKVYPEGFPQYARTYTYTVNSDIKEIRLALPKGYSSTVAPGAVFNVFSKFTNYLNQTAEAADITDYSRFTNQRITFTSSAPDYVSVDNLGNVTIIKADSASKRVTITAVAENSANGRKVTSNALSINIKGSGTSGNTSTTGNNQPKVNQTVQDSVTGATVTVTKTGGKNLEGEVKYVKPAGTGSIVAIPDTVTINGVKYKVTSIAANAFSGITSLTKVTIPASVTKIESKAFYNCKKLKTVTFSGNSGLIEIGDGAFQKCSALTKISIPAKVKKIGKNAFNGCKKLKTVSISSKSQLTEIGDSAFYNCIVMTKITIPNKVKKIGAKAFYNCKKLKNITIKSTVLSSVGKNAFKNIYKKAVIKVPKKKLSAYKTLLKGKGQKKTVKIKK